MQSQDDDAVPSTPPGGWPTPSPASSSQADPIKANIAEAVLDRRDEYIVRKKIKVKVGTWNVASTKGTENDVKNWFVKEQEIIDHLASLKLGEKSERKAEPAEAAKSGTDEFAEHDKPKDEEYAEENDENQEIGVYVLGLQEIVDIGSPALLLNPYVDPAPAQKWRHAVEEALPLGYQPVAQQQLVGLCLMVYASPLVKPFVSDVSAVSVATGGGGWTGNKGAVVIRIVLGGITRMLFVNSHLTAGNEKGNLDRRNWDVTQIVARAKFPAVENELVQMEGKAEAIGDEDFAFWFGDLNYRLDGIPGEDVRRLLTLHTKGEYGQEPRLSSEISDLAYSDATSEARTSSETSEQPPSSVTLVDEEAEAEGPSVLHKDQMGFTSDPTSLQTTLSSLLSHDQLHSQIEQHKAFHDGWQEGDITFPPTYKYDVGTLSTFDSSEKMRSPSWCDRILYRTKKRKQALEMQRAQVEIRNPKLEQQPSGILFDYNPDEDEEEAATDPIDQLNSESDDVHLRNYLSHQSITSSDHKPLEATFTIHFSAEDKVKKDRVYWNVARMFDNAENENRPRVTLVSNPMSFTGNRTIDFGAVKYGEQHQNELTVANTGTKEAYVRVINVNKDAPSWLSIAAPEEGSTLGIGDVLTINLQFCVTDKEMGWCLNSGTEDLEHIVIVRVEGGADYFVSIRAKWTPFAWVQ